MSCYACSKKYGWFCKEAGCPNCGFSFCTKCLKKSIKVPRCGNEERKVCLTCFEKLSAQEIASQSISSSIQQSTTKSSPLKLDPNQSVLDAPIPDEEQVPDVDEEIKKRLEVMKQPINDLDQPFSDRSIAERLASLKDVPHKEYDNRAMLNAVDTRTEHQMANDLVDQFMKEVNLDDAVKNDCDDQIQSIERRLAALKGSPIAMGDADKKPIGDPNDESPQDEETLAKKIVTKYLDEAALPDSDLTPEEKEFVNSVKPDQPQEELPWCTICNEDASIRCIGCDGDLFCRPCFKEIHANDEEYMEHRTKAFVPKDKDTQQTQ